MNGSLSDAVRPASQATTIHNLNAASSTFNFVNGDQYITNIHPAPITPLASRFSAQARSQAPFNDAPVDNLSSNFTGRKRQLVLIAEAFKQRRNIPYNIPRRCALFGNQGVGKSQLTYSWAKWTFARKENAYIMWISSTTVEKLFQGFCRLLRFINHPDQSHPDQNARLEAARRWLEEVDTGNWLLIFDNVFPETVDFLRQHLPRTNRRGTILFTTRTQEVATAVTSTAGERHDVIEVPTLNVKEGVEMFCRHFDAGKVDPSSPKVEAIVKAVGCLPLAISHIAAYMGQSRTSLDNLLELFKSKHVIDVISWEHTLSDYEHKSVAATFASQLQGLRQQYPDASKLLRVIAFLDHESIPLEMLTTGATTIVSQTRPTRSPFKASLLALIQSPVALQKAVTQLQTQCLVAHHISHTSQPSTIHIHDLIQLVILENTRSSEVNGVSFELAVELVCAAFGKIKDPQSPEWWPQCELLVSHIQSLTLRQDISNKAKKALHLANHRRGMYLSSRGRYVEAERLYENVIADREQLCGYNDLESITMMHNLASVYKCRGRYVDAEKLFKQVLESFKTRLGPERRRTLKTMYLLAEVYFYQERYDDAKALLKQTLQRQESRFGAHDNHTLRTMNKLADVYDSQKDYDDAELLLKRVLRARENIFGMKHPYTLNTKHSLANVYFSQRHYGSAAALFKQILCASETVLGPQHPDTLATMHALACVYASQNYNAEAETLFVHVLTGRNKVYGRSHPHTQMTVQRLLSVYTKLGRVKEAGMLTKHFMI